MIVKELEEILSTIKNNQLKVFMNGYYTQEINGYFFSENDGHKVLMLTTNNVQPRIMSDNEV